MNNVRQLADVLSAPLDSTTSWYRVPWRSMAPVKKCLGLISLFSLFSSCLSSLFAVSLVSLVHVHRQGDKLYCELCRAVIRTVHQHTRRQKLPDAFFQAAEWAQGHSVRKNAKKEITKFHRQCQKKSWRVAYVRWKKRFNLSLIRDEPFQQETQQSSPNREIDCQRAQGPQRIPLSFALFL